MTHIAYELFLGTKHMQAYHDEVEALASILEHMREDNFRPDVIVGLGRGGLISAVWASHALKVPMIPIQWSTRDFAAKTTNVNELITPYQNVLILDELSDTGQAFTELQEALEPSYTKERTIKFAALMVRMGTEFVPDYIGTHVLEQEWITFACEHVGEILGGVELQSDVEGEL